MYNYLKLIKQTQSTINVWKKRALTLNGKVLVIKTFIISKLLYEAEINGIPDTYIQIIEKMIKDFYGIINNLL